MIKKTLQRIELNPKELFLIDGFGAIVSAFMLGVILVQFEYFFGIPSSTLYILAAIPIFFVFYDFFCYRKKNHQIGPYLRVIAILNLLYSCLSLGFAFYHVELIKFWGWYYIISEIIILVALSFYEFKIANQLIHKEI